MRFLILTERDSIAHVPIEMFGIEILLDLILLKLPQILTHPLNTVDRCILTPMIAIVSLFVAYGLLPQQVLVVS